MGFKTPVRPKTKAQLMAIANPQMANQPEALPWILFDTQTYVDNTTTRLTFFQTTSTDPSITNMETAGQLPDPQFFEIHYFGLDVLRDVTTAAGGTAGAIDDIQKLILTNRMYWAFTISNKKFGYFPATFLHASGGATGFGWGTFTAEESIQYGNNGLFDGGYAVDGALVIPPKVGFTIETNWPAAVDITADVKLRFWMAGVLYRRVL